MSIIAAAQKSGQKQLRFNRLFLKDGLIESQVYQIEQDDEGYMWFGTRTGLVRFDGYSPKTYQLETKVISRSNISALCKDRMSRLWVAAAYEGLFYYDRANDKFIHCDADSLSEKLLQSSIIKKIQNDASGNLWLNLLNKTNSVLSEKDAYETVMLYNVNTHSFTSFSNNGKDNQRVKYKKYLSPLVTDKFGNTWCGSDSGLYKYDIKNNSFKPHLANNPFFNRDIFHLAINPAHPELIWVGNNDQLLLYSTLRKKVIARAALRGEDISKVSFDSKNQLWVAGSAGLSYFDYKNNNFINCNTTAIADFMEDLSGGFWCTTSKGLAYFNKNTNNFTEYSGDENLNSLFGYPGAIFIDKNSTLWISIFGAGIQWVNKQSSSIEKYQIRRNISPSVNGLAQSADSALWLATDAGLYQLNSHNASLIGITSGGLNKESFGCILAGSNDNIWLGGAGKTNGVFCYNTSSKKVTNFKYDDNDSTTISGARISDLLEDRNGNIWIGTWGGGVCKLDAKTKKVKRFSFIVNLEKTPSENKLDDKDALSLYQDKTGVLWVGTNAGSLNRFDANTQRFISYQNSSNVFRCILNISEDEKNRLWASTYSAGLFPFDREKETVNNISIKDGLLSNFCGGMLIDDYNNIWLNSAKGISIYNPGTGAVRTVTNDVMQTDFPPFFSFKTNKGSFIFPVNKGLAIINPNDFKTDSIPPVVHIESVVYNKPQSKNRSFDSAIFRFGKNRLDLKYDENRITFNYVGLIFQNVEQVRYKYKLDGYDNNWVNANTQRTVTYTNLAPGTYTFHVKAANSDGVWSTTDDSITIIIAPPLWQTWWFRTLVVLVIAALIFWAVKSYLNRKLRLQQQEFEKLKAIEKVRAKISMDIHDEISSGLTKISLLSQRVENKFEHNKEIEPEVIKKINSSSKEVISNLGEIIWAVNPKHDNLQSLLAYIRNYVANFFEATSIELNIDFPDEVVPVNVSPDIKHNLFLVIKEALNNIVKHSGATEVIIQFSCLNEKYIFIIKDNGKGIDQTNRKLFGNGLMNMKKRMSNINGEITIGSNEQKGTVITIEGKFV